MTGLWLNNLWVKNCSSRWAEEPNGLFAWVREEKSSSAEVDFLINVDSQIVPIEVKAGAVGKLRSLKLFLSEKKISLGVRISELGL